MIAASLGLAAQSSARGDDPKPTRDAFISEVLDAKPTPATPKFHDVGDSYHILKEDLLKGVTEEAAKRKLGLRGVLIAGPMRDPLWTSVVVVFLREGDKVRVNLLIFPHARITYKATGLVTAKRFDEWVIEVHKSSILRRELPEAARKEKDEKKRDWAYTLLLATWDADGKGRRLDYATPEAEDEEKRDQFQEAVNAMTEDLNDTYNVYKD
jgi:hypothetical protein